MAKRVLCFGDSNTYGFDPRDILEKRYPPEERWPDILSLNTGWETCNLGLNGRTIPFSGTETQHALGEIRKKLPADCLILMLGSNDALTMGTPSARKVALRMDAFLSVLRENFPELTILLVSPPLVEIPLAHIQDLFRELIPLYRALAQKHGTLFASSPAWQLPLSADGVHLSAEANRIFASRIEDILSTRL